MRLRAGSGAAATPPSVLDGGKGHGVTSGSVSWIINSGAVTARGC